MSTNTKINHNKLWPRFILKLKSEQPFFASIALFAKFSISDNIDVALTQNKSVSISSKFLSTLTEPECFSYLLHQVLHLALGHAFRGKSRNQSLWNIAADIVVNNIIKENTKLPVAPKTAWDFRFSGDSVEKVYALLQRESANKTMPPNVDSANETKSEHSADHINDNVKTNSLSHKKNKLKDYKSGESKNTRQASNMKNAANAIVSRYNAHADFCSESGSKERIAKEYWRGSMIKARQIQKTKNWGVNSGDLQREIEISIGGQLNWRKLLWRYATPSSDDYEEFDNRFIYKGIYIEVLQSEELHVDVVIDTSASISKEELECFVRELIAINNCHPNIKINFFYLDTKLHGPYAIPSSLEDFPIPLGGGGTSFTPYFSHFSNEYTIVNGAKTIIFFTDGYGEFPKQKPNAAVLWVVPEDGEKEDKFPFGVVVNLRC